MKTLSDLLEGMEYINSTGSVDIPISHIAYDSRKCGADGLFVAIPGALADGHDYIDAAVAGGVAAVVCERMPKPKAGVCYIQTENARAFLAHLSHAFYDNPTEKLKVIGVTGTNGKTTITYILRDMLRVNAEKCAVIGTTGILMGDEKIEATHTTPESLELCALFDLALKKGIKTVVMEVSSHALEQHRCDGIHFDGALFTNLTPEHLDFHKTMDEYAKAKKILFDMLPEQSIAIVFDNSKYTDFLLRDCPSRHKYKIGRHRSNDYVIEGEQLGLSKSEYLLNHCGRQYSFATKLPGRFNIDNSAMCAAYGLLIQMDEETIRKSISQSQGAPGRMQRTALHSGAVGVVDYAHTPDALEKALLACREIQQMDATAGKLICVFGCGGDRDKSKRPVMGKIATDIADFVIITNDNPRTEEPQSIINDILSGIDGGEQNSKITVIPDRAEAIKKAAQQSSADDIVLVAGKGHETYQILGKEKVFFDDLQELAKYK